MTEKLRILRSLKLKKKHLVDQYVSGPWGAGYMDGIDDAVEVVKSVYKQNSGLSRIATALDKLVDKIYLKK